jgi:hypothetical protein
MTSGSVEMDNRQSADQTETILNTNSPDQAPPSIAESPEQTLSLSLSLSL